jgi:hypothetical protein
MAQSSSARHQVLAAGVDHGKADDTAQHTGPRDFVLRAMQSMASCLPDVIAKIPTTGLTLARYSGPCVTSAQGH